ncbi:MAG: nitrile hydratase subunit beta [Alphaproteobacteria bacterium]
MDGVHDIGGRQGFGPIAVDEKEEPFHAPWEGRMLGIARGMRQPPGWNIDWWRHGRELIDPLDYLSRPYYDQWMQTYAALLVDAGIATVEELVKGRSSTAPFDFGRPLPPEAVPALRTSFNRFDREITRPPAFNVGAAVRAAMHGTPGHTRLPGYARGRRGTIAAYRGAHIFPDANSKGEERAEPLYSVSFAASELWPEAKESRDLVYLDLWESYLDRA